MSTIEEHVAEQNAITAAWEAAHPPRLYKATIEILVEAREHAEACDAVSEAMRPLLKKYAAKPEHNSFVDWQYVAAGGPTIEDGAEFDEYMEDKGRGA